MALFALSMLVSCRTTQKVTEVYVHDTLRVNTSDTVYITRHKTDSVIDIRFVNVNDTVIREIERLIVLNAQGDTIKEKESSNTTHHTHESNIAAHSEKSVDSTAFYKSRIDSLQRIVNEKECKKEVVQKGASLRDKLVFILIVALVIFCVFKYIRY